jgi:hypothetical protein
MTFRSLKYTYVGKKKYYWQTNAEPDQKHCLFPGKFAICGLAHLRNLLICDCGMSPKICGIAILRTNNKICGPTFVDYLLIYRLSSRPQTS